MPRDPERLPPAPPDDHIVTPEEEALIRERLETADEDEKTAIPWEELREQLERQVAARRCEMTQPDAVPDFDDDAGELPITPEEERILEERERTLEEDEKTARPAAEVIEELLRKFPQ